MTQLANKAEAWPKIPGYTILELAGEGGMGIVYKAEQEQTKRIVAIKMLPIQSQDAISTSANINPLESFKHEAHLIARLEHPHILPVFDYGEYEGNPFLVMRYLESSVADRLREQGQIPFEQASQWIKQIADALDFAHHEGIVHKDVKPSNMLLDEHGNAYLTDFGIAGVATGEGKSGVGSAFYMPPEQSMGELVDTRADVYALAVSLFELLTGERPYQAETSMGIIVRHMHDPIPSAHLMNPDISHSTSTLLQWGMAKDPNNRPSSPSKFARLLSLAAANPDVSLRAMPDLKQMAIDLNIRLDDELIEQTLTGLPRVEDTVLMSEEEHKQITGVLDPPASSNSLLYIIGGVILFLVLGTGVIIAMGGPTAIAGLASPVPPPTVTLPPTRTPLPTPTATPVGRLLLDDFSDTAQGFAPVPIGESGGVAYQEGGLRFESRGRLLWVSQSQRLNVEDATIDVAVTLDSVSGMDRVGVLCRLQTEEVDGSTFIRRGITLATSQNGSAQIASIEDGALNVLETADVSAELGDRLTDSATLTALCEGDTLQLFVDGELIIEAEDPDPISGDVGLSLIGNSNEEAVAIFDNIEVTE